MESNSNVAAIKSLAKKAVKVEYNGVTLTFHPVKPSARYQLYGLVAQLEGAEKEPMKALELLSDLQVKALALALRVDEEDAEELLTAEQVDAEPEAGAEINLSVITDLGKRALTQCGLGQVAVAFDDAIEQADTPTLQAAADLPSS